CCTFTPRALAAAQNAEFGESLLYSTILRVGTAEMAALSSSMLQLDGYSVQKPGRLDYNLLRLSYVSQLRKRLLPQECTN
ncbi:MAG: hypothetical protein PHX21_13995, partial [bacterium]|nr:hypothetical protein [bacterium]